MQRRAPVALVVVSVVAAVSVVATSVEAGQGQCEELEFKLQAFPYPLPTNLTVKPLATTWHVNFTLHEKGEEADVCVVMAKTKDNIKLMHSDCENGDPQFHEPWHKDLMPPDVWTSILLKVKNSTVFLTASINNTLKLEFNSSSLSNIFLQVTEEENVKVAVLRQVNCTLSNHTAEEPDFRSKVGEWRQKKLHFYFRPRTESDNVRYELVCKTMQEQDNEFRHGVDLQPESYVPELWHQVDLEQQDNKVKVEVNNEKLEIISLPDFCNTSIHTIWTVGDAAFCFECDQKQGGEEVDPCPIKLLMSAVITLAVVVFIPIATGLCICISCRSKGINSRTFRELQLKPTSDSVPDEETTDKSFEGPLPLCGLRVKLTYAVTSSQSGQGSDT